MSSFNCPHCKNEIKIITEANIESKTGVEMEALTAASVAALTVYDMCKAMSHNIIIKEIKLLAKSGGKSDYQTT